MIEEPEVTNPDQVEDDRLHPNWTMMRYPSDTEQVCLLSAWQDARPAERRRVRRWFKRAQRPRGQQTS